jgi:2-oxoglutarate ferredoxin oxidoreductase subunit beta
MRYPDFPEPMGVFRCVDNAHYEDLVVKQIQAARDQRGEGKLDKLFASGDVWTVN